MRRYELEVSISFKHIGAATPYFIRLVLVISKVKLQKTRDSPAVQI